MLHKNSPDRKDLMNADDTVLFFANRDVSLTQKNLNSDFDLMGTWLGDTVTVCFNGYPI